MSSTGIIIYGSKQCKLIFLVYACLSNYNCGQIQTCSLIGRDSYNISWCVVFCDTLYSLPLMLEGVIYPHLPVPPPNLQFNMWGRGCRVCGLVTTLPITDGRYVTYNVDIPKGTSPPNITCSGQGVGRGCSGAACRLELPPG